MRSSGGWGRRDSWGLTDILVNDAGSLIERPALSDAMECAKVIVFLASDAASYVVGESIEINGGQLVV